MNSKTDESAGGADTGSCENADAHAGLSSRLGAEFFLVRAHLVSLVLARLEGRSRHGMVP